MDAEADRKRAREETPEEDEDELAEKSARTGGEDDMDLSAVTRDMNAEPAAQMFNGDEHSDAHEGEVLKVKPELIQAAKIAEHDQLVAFDTYDIVPRSEVDKSKIIGSRWVLVNKGSTDQPRVKARLVAKDFWRKEGPNRCSLELPG